MTTSFHRMFIIFYIQQISCKSQFIKSLPGISDTWQPALDNCNHNLLSMSKSKSECKNVCRMKWRIIRHRYQRFDLNVFLWFEKLLNQQLFSNQCNYTCYLISIYEISIRGKNCPELPAVPNYPDCPYWKIFILKKKLYIHNESIKSTDIQKRR